MVEEPGSRHVDALSGGDWQAVVDSLPQRVFLVDDRHVVLVDNRPMRERAGGTLVGRTCHEALQDRAEPCASCPSRELLGLEVLDDGTELPPCGLIRCAPLRTASGGLRVLVSETSSTELVTPELAAGTPLLSKLLQNSVDAVIAADPEGNILVFNEEAERILGHDAGQVVGQMTLTSLFPEGVAQDVVEKLGSGRSGGKGRLASCSTSMRHADGSAIPVTLRASTLYDGEGELATLWFVQGGQVDDDDEDERAEEQPTLPGRSSALERLAARITNQVRSPLSGMFLFSNLLMQQLVRRELHRADAFLWNLIQGSVDAIIASDTKGNIFIFNDEAERILGYTTEEVVGKAHISLIYSIEEAREVMRRLRSEDYGGRGKLQSHDMELVHKDGRRIPVRLKASIVYVNGVEFASVGFFQDQRDRIKMGEDLKRAQVQLLQSEKMASLGKLAAGIAHQINNPLSGIVLFSNLLLENTELTGEAGVESDLRRIADDAQRCSSIVKELLEFARQTQDQVKPVNLSRSLSQTIFLLEKQPLFQNIEVVKDYCADEPIVHAEPQQLNHVFMNLILNAAEAMDGRGVLTLRTRKVEGQEAFEFEVADTGSGIPAEIRSRVFEPFFTTKEVGKGTGLGLSVVYGIVERHGGRIRIESEPGQGTSFTVSIPVGQPPPE